MLLMGKIKFSREAGRKAVSFLALLAMVLTLLPAVPAMAGQVANASVTAGNLKAGAPGVSYTVSFDATSGLEPGDEITVVFPTGYDVTGVTVTGITYDGKVYQPGGTALGNIFRVGVPAELTVPAGGNVAVRFSGVKNPTKAGSYQFAVRTTVDTTTAYGSVTIEPDVAKQIAITGPQSGSNIVANQVVPVELAIQDQYGNLTTMDNDLTVMFTLNETIDDNSAKLYADSAAIRELTDNKLVIAAGYSGGTVYLTDTEEEGVTIAAADEQNNLTPPGDLTVTVKPYGALARLVFVKPPAQLTAGDPVSFTLQLQDAYGNPVPAGANGVAVTLTASGANTDTVIWL
ncbi:MAG: hypothetical protein ACPLRU_02420, partial [Desulfofundulus sp.]